MTKKVTLKPIMDGFEKIYYDYKVYDARTEPEYFLGGRLTDCCETFSTIDDGPLYCKKCYHEVEWGEGDGSENISHNYKVKWRKNKKNKVTSCEVVELSEEDFIKAIKARNGYVFTIINKGELNVG